MGRQDDASTVLADSREIDGLDAWLRDLAGLPIDADEQTHLDVALEYRALGDTQAARRVLEASRAAPRLSVLRVPSSPGHSSSRRAPTTIAGCSPTGWTSTTSCSPVWAPGWADSTTPRSVPSFTALGCWYYAHDRAADAIAAWEDAVSSDPTSWQAWRNLGLAHYNTGRDLESARSCYARALALRPHDDRLAYEADQLASLAGVPIDRRLDSLSPRRGAPRPR